MRTGKGPDRAAGRRRKRASGAGDPLLDAARRLDRGEPVDWDALGRANPAATSAIEGLRLLQSIARACAGPVDVPARPPEPSGSTLFSWGPLEVIEKIGEGGFGEVYRGFDPVLRRDVALKLHRFGGAFDEASFQQSLEEARRLARVRHPNVLAVHGVEVHDGRAGMWLDLIRGETLEHRLRREGPFPPEEIVRVGIDICAALAAVHGAGLLHGDIKTGNVMIEEPGGRVVLMDFGAGTRIDIGDATARAHPGASPQATPIAMAPEQFAGSPPSVASDLYALGTLLYRIAGGRYPVEAASLEDLERKHAEAPRLSIAELRPGLRPSLALAIDRCLAPDPANRPGSAAEVRGILETAGPDLPDGHAGAATMRAQGHDPDDAAENARRSGALPRFTTRLVGRAREVLEVRRMLLEPGLVTLFGAGGCGKTRLAHEVARGHGASLTGGARWVDLSTIHDPALVQDALARALEVIPARGQDPLDAIAMRLRDETILIVLDNCEHLREACASLASVLVGAGRRVRVLATSREALGLPGERTWHVPSLALPPDPSRADPSITDYESVRLFVDRATRSDPAFVLTQREAPAVARIVTRLDGIPLAIELAAGRVGTLTVGQIAERLDEALRLLADRGSAASPRQRTIRASIGWSHDLLSEEDRTLFRRLAVFEGGWTLEAAEEVCGESLDVVERLDSLVRCSLVQSPRATDGSAPRYRFLETVRAYAREQLEAAAEGATLRDRHLGWCARVARAEGRRIYGPEEDAAILHLEAEIDNMRAALAWTLARPRGPGRDPEAGLHLSLYLRHFWYERGSFREGLAHFLDQIEGATEPTLVRGRALSAASAYCEPLTEFETGKRLIGEALAILRRENDGSWIGASLGTLALLAQSGGDLAAARAHYTEALRVHAEGGNRQGVAHTLINYGQLEEHCGDLAAAESAYRKGLDLFRELGDEGNAAIALANSSSIALRSGDRPGARERIEEAEGILRRAASRSALAPVLLQRARVEIADGKPREARRAGLEALALACASEDRPTRIDSLLVLAMVQGMQGRPQLAARILGATQAAGLALLPGRRSEIERLQTDLEGVLGPAAFDVEWAAGRALTQDEALRLAQETA